MIIYDNNFNSNREEECKQQKLKTFSLKKFKKTFS